MDDELCTMAAAIVHVHGATQHHLSVFLEELSEAFTTTLNDVAARHQGIEVIDFGGMNIDEEDA